VRALRAGLPLAVCACGLVALSSCFPRMREQPSLKPFERPMPAMPEGTVSREGADPVSWPDESPKPPMTDAKALASGRLYYGYYCAMCHGEDGRGRTPVGEAYWPRPTDLTSPQVQSQTDASLYRAMLTGVGHEPVLASTVARDRRWPIVIHLRTLKPRP